METRLSETVSKYCPTYNLASIFRNTLVLGNPREYRNKFYIGWKLHSLAYISVAESVGVSSTTFT